MVHKGKSPTRKGLPEGRKGCVRAGERQEKATGSRPATGYLMTIYWFGGAEKNGRLLPFADFNGSDAVSYPMVSNTEVSKLRACPG